MASDMEHFVPIPKRLLDDILAISREFQAIYTFFPANAKEIFNRFKAKLNEINGEFRVLSGPRLGLVSRWTVKLNFILLSFFLDLSQEGPIRLQVMETEGPGQFSLIFTPREAYFLVIIIIIIILLLLLLLLLLLFPCVFIM